jgi:hypothetical protein
MSLGLALTTFVPSTTISSSSMNSNFSAINAAALPSDSGAISTSGGGILTATGFTLGNSEHIILGTSSTIRFNSQDVLYTETASGHTDIQLYGSGGQIRFKDQSGNTIAAINPADHSLAFADSGQNLHDIIYVNTGANETYIQALGSGKIRIKDNNGNDLASIDNSGNLRTKGTMTASVTP